MLRGQRHLKHWYRDDIKNALSDGDGATHMTRQQVQNYVAGEWRSSSANDFMPVVNPATAEELARTPLSTSREVDDAVQAAAKAFPEWRRIPVGTRVQYQIGRAHV